MALCLHVCIGQHVGWGTTHLEWKIGRLVKAPNSSGSSISSSGGGVGVGAGAGVVQAVHWWYTGGI